MPLCFGTMPSGVAWSTISGSDIKNVVDPQRLSQMAKQQGMSPDQLSDHVAQALPHLVDQATPDGQVPKQGGKDVPAGKSRKK